jgi:glyoxylase-like metal-dependent hydrolase (beta-lactamase superfamily II)
VASLPVPRLDTDITLDGTNVTVLIGVKQGKYPTSNSVLVTGSEASVLADPSIDVHARGGAPSSVDRVLISHAHEDHLAGIGMFPDCCVHAHHHDVNAVRNLDSLMAVYGMPQSAADVWRQQLLTDFHYTPRPDATGFTDGEVFDLGGSKVTVVHLPGHTRGHSGFLIEPDGVFFVADIDLSSFGPYYGDHWSDLDDFELAMDRATEVDAHWYVTSHHKGIVEGRQEFISALSTFRSVIGTRDERIVAFLKEPRTLADMVAHRFIYRPDTTGLLWIDHVEENSITMHLNRLVRQGAVTKVESDRFQTA